MDIKVQSVHFDADTKLLEFINAKVGKLERFYDNIIGGVVTLKLEHVDNMENKIVDVKVLIPGNDLFANRSAKTFEAAVDLSVDALRRQLEKIKEKQRNI
ncbi:MAG: ribosomal subunit interface protein [Bacteroidetes bacterium HGW-Bacteroidetes-4]|jgi:putative sigma-54 modulation protein|nr:MAG: ribosomal subunit interface protein [Bacteroidetes bacterium HGW-Bacteroidetes-4]